MGTSGGEGGNVGGYWLAELLWWAWLFLALDTQSWLFCGRGSQSLRFMAQAFVRGPAGYIFFSLPIAAQQTGHPIPAFHVYNTAPEDMDRPKRYQLASPFRSPACCLSSYPIQGTPQLGSTPFGW